MPWRVIRGNVAKRLSVSDVERAIYPSICCASMSRLNAMRRSRVTAAK
jgi:hypothetical protein